MEYPKYLNTKFDYYYVMKHFPKEKWLPDFKELIRDYTKWMKGNKLAKKEDGLSDVTHKIVEEEDEETKEKKYLQYEFKEDPNCKIKRLGFTLAEVEKIVKDQEEAMK